MSQHDPWVSLQQMRDHANEAVGFAGQLTREELQQNRILFLAATHLLEIVGEAARRIPPEFQSRFPQLPWRDVTGMRNRLSHGYDSVDLGIVHDVIVKDMPLLVHQLEAILQSKP